MITYQSTSIFTIFALIIVLLASCDKDPTPTIFKGTVVRDSTGTAVPQASLLIQPVNAEFPTNNILENYHVATDEFGAFDFTVPGEVGGEKPSRIRLDVYTGEWPFPDDEFRYSEVDLLFEGDVGDAASAQSFAPGKTYDFTIRLLR